MKNINKINSIDIVDLTTIIVGDFIKYCGNDTSIQKFKKMNFKRRKKVVDIFISEFMSRNSSKISV